ncbi:hypothetical protein TSAR_002002 [Trichomalopsis sarcophagae]|uniref:Uncharacterized protein n=1 Tax=Trichomalopsis sarcophagae TaxID=543379 RepID=A0A232ENE9_9HYME|nr:hypothetical protein TSAR_002002 [Trichomalopsis sarcophagae]
MCVTPRIFPLLLRVCVRRMIFRIAVAGDRYLAAVSGSNDLLVCCQENYGCKSNE